MQIKKPTLLIALLSTCLLTTTTFISCNNDGEKKEEIKEVPSTPPPIAIDTQKVNSLTPTTDSLLKKDSLIKGRLKPVNTKPVSTPPPGGS